MRWLWFVGSLVCFAIVFKTASIGLAVLALLGALAFGLIGVVAVASERIDGRSRDATALLGPDELRRMREIEAKRRAGAEGSDRTTPVLAVGGAALVSDSASRTTYRDHDAIDNGTDSGSGGDAGGGDGGGGD